MFMSSYGTEEDHELVEEIFIRIGILMQSQDDYLDIYGDPAITGKIGTDIVEGKCCWLIVKALELCNDKQKEVLIQNYGKKDENCVNAVKAVYNDLNLKEIYPKEEEVLYNEICQSINDLKHKTDLSPKIFTNFLAKIYRRNK